MKARLKDLTISRQGEQVLTLALSKGEDATTLFDNLIEKQIDVTIKQYYDKRSLRANRYAWLLSNQLASKMRTSNDEMHFNLLLRYGQTDIIELRKDIDPSRYFEYYRLRNEGELFNEYLVAVGSRHYNTSEMARFIDGIVSECKEQGIPTETPEEIAKMVSLWQSQ
jgi:hypothetical protein